MLHLSFSKNILFADAVMKQNTSNDESIDEANKVGI